MGLQRIGHDWAHTHNQNIDSNKIHQLKRIKLQSSDVLRNYLSGDKNLILMFFFHSKFSLIFLLGNQTETYVNHLFIEQTPREGLLFV